VSLDTFIDGNNDQGHIIKVITGANGTIQSMDMRVNAVSEQLDF